MMRIGKARLSPFLKGCPQRGQKSARSADFSAAPPLLSIFKVRGAFK